MILVLVILLLFAVNVFQFLKSKRVRRCLGRTSEMRAASNILVNPEHEIASAQIYI